VTRLLVAWTNGNRAALEELIPVVYPELRRILVDHAREHAAEKRGGGARPVTLVDAMAASPDRGIDILALDEALQRFTALYP
jgi:hypothetical protein